LNETGIVKIRHHRSKPPGLLLIVHLLAVLLLSTPALFRRTKQKITREDAFRDLFVVLQSLFEHAAHMKPRWQQEWQERDADGLPDKYCFGNALATDAAIDMRFASRLLHRNRWKSVVEPLFDEVDERAWNAFQDTADRLALALLNVSDSHIDRLLGDERDWVDAAVEQFDDATRRRRQSKQTDSPMSLQVAEGVYLPVYVAIQLADRLIERMRYEAEQAK
jgi:hypothetical protein